MSPTSTASASGKVILFGEHAVVYGRPAIAVPVVDVAATATVRPSTPGAGCVIVAHDLDETIRLADAPSDHPLALVVRLSLDALPLIHSANPDWEIAIRSTIPVASGLGSGAAVSTAIVRAIFAHVGHAAPPEQVSPIVYRSEEVHHGTPSGIDNTVIAYERPVWFVRGASIQTFTVTKPFMLAVADSGIPSPTKTTVGDVRRQWQTDPKTYESIFDEIGQIAKTARQAIEQGIPHKLGALMDQNQTLLAQIGISSPEVERIIEAARRAGARGAKLSGGGRGGNVIALVNEASQAAVSQAMQDAGAQRVLLTNVR